MAQIPEESSGRTSAPLFPHISRPSLLDWVTATVSDHGQSPAAHHRLLLWELDALSRGANDRLMVLMPPGSAKSTYATIAFPPWWFLQHPNSSIISTCHTASLAVHFARQVRQLIATSTGRLGYGLEAGGRAAGEWRTSAGGEYFATGLRGPIMGRRADLAIIDDPIKNQLEADSAKARERIWNWYQFDLTTRLKPKGRVILIMTRWHEDDLAGRLLAHNPEEWRCLRLPAMAEATDPLGRTPETPLWPDWEDQPGLSRRRGQLGPRGWSALYQQSPTDIGGALFQVERIDFIDTLPTETPKAVRAWDLAGTAQIGGNDPDWTVGLKLIRDALGRFIVADIVRLRGSPLETQNAVMDTARRDGRSVPISLPTDPGQSGRSQISSYTSMLAGYVIKSSPESGAKETRALPVATQIEGQNVAVLRATWNYSFIDELRTFPFGRKDDQVDALSRAFQFIIGSPSEARKITVPLMAR